MKCTVKKRDLLYKTDASFIISLCTYAPIDLPISVLTYLYPSQSVHSDLSQFLNTYLTLTIHIYLYVYLVLFKHWWISFQQSLHVFISFPVWNLYLSIKTTFHKTIHEFYFAHLHPLSFILFWFFFSVLIQFFKSLLLLLLIEVKTKTKKKSFLLPKYFPKQLL